jgi:hypothetical protein
VANAECDRAHVDVSKVAVEKVGDDLDLAGREHFFRDLPAGVEAAARKGDLAAHTGKLHLQSATIGREHDEAAFGAGHFDGGVQHEREHLVDDAAGAERAEGFEQGGQLADVADGGELLAVGRGRRRVLDEEPHFGAGGAAELDVIAVAQRALRDLLAIDKRAVAGPSIAQDVAAVRLRNLGMVARNVTPGQPKVVLAPPSNGDERLVDRDDPAPEPVVDFETCAWHGSCES